MHEIVEGIHHWSVFHRPIGLAVSSYAIPAAGIVIDPKLPAEGVDALPGRPQQVVLTTGLHDRDARRVADALDIPIRAPREARERLGDALEVEPYADGDEIAPGVTAIRIGKLCPDEYALHVAAGGGAIAVADGLHTYGGALDFFSDDLLGDDPQAVKDGLRDAYRGVLTRDFEHLLVAHGDPVVGGAKSALRGFLGDR